MERHFDEELRELKEKLLQMASLAEDSISRSIKALTDRDKKLAQKVIDLDDEINMLEIEVDEICLKLLALRQPAAGDLRLLTAILKINNDLERVADQAVNITEIALELMKQPLLKPLIDIPKMAALAQLPGKLQYIDAHTAGVFCSQVSYRAAVRADNRNL